MSGRVLMLVENLPVPFDRRVWQEACTLRDAGWTVSVICPTGKGFEKKLENIEGVAVYRYSLPVEASGALGYALEYGAALFWSLVLSLRVLLTRGFDVIHACNPPDLFFLIGGFYKLFGKKFVFDHHDLGPELYEAKFGRRDFLHRLLLKLERWTFRTADVSIATNESYRDVAIGRGGMRPDRVFIVRSGPSLERLKTGPPQERWKRGRKYLVGYVGVMGRQEGIDLLLHAVSVVVHCYARKDVHFALAGGGTSLEALRALAHDLAVAEYVTFTGRVPDAELLAMLNSADVCVNPDRGCALNDKSTMNKVLEYMALAKPVVQFDLTEGRRSAGEAALYARTDDPVDLAVKILELLEDAPRRACMGRFGRARIERGLEGRHQAPRLLAAYEAVCKGAVPSPAQRSVET